MPEPAVAAALEAVIAGTPGVRDWRVLERTASDGTLCHVAYVAGDADAPPAADALAAALRAAADGRVHVLLLPALPRTADGEVDDASLVRMPVVDGALAARVEATLAGPGGAPFAVIDLPVAEARPPLHLSALVPDWRRTFAAAAADGPERDDADATPASAVPALAVGPALVPDSAGPRTLVEALLATARDHGATTLTFAAPGGASSSLTYAGLLDAASRLLGGLRRAGLAAGDVALLQVTALEEFVPAFWACLLGGIRPLTVAIPPAYDAQHAVVQKLRHAWELTGHPPVVASDDVAAQVLALAGAAAMPGLEVISLSALSGAGPATPHAARPEDTAFIQLSSGSTGRSKGIQITHRGVIAHTRASRQAIGRSSSDVTCNWLPMDHVAPLLMMHVADVCYGAAQVHAPTDLILGSPVTWLDLMDRHRVTHTWSPNFGYRLVVDALASGASGSWDLSCVRSLINGGEQVTAEVLRDFLAALAPFGLRPEAMRPTYGMAETCTAVAYEVPYDAAATVRRIAVASLRGTVRDAGPDEPALLAVSNGRPVPGVTLRIAGTALEVLAEGRVGRIQVRGDVVTPGYLHDAEATRAALVGDGWLDTGDLGFLQGGRLYVTGREKEQIRVNGANVACYDVETLVGAIPGVDGAHVAAFGVPDGATGTEALAVFLALRPGAGGEFVRIAAAARRELASRLGVTPGYLVPVAPADIPRTTSGKIQRTALRAALAGGRFDAALAEADLQQGNDRTVPDWFHRRTWQRVRLPGLAPVQAGSVAIVGDPGGRGTALAAALTAAGAMVVHHPEPQGDAYWERVLAELGAAAAEGGTIVDLRQAGPADRAAPVLDEALRTGASALALVQALARARRSDAAWRVVTVASESAAVTADEPVWAPRLAGPAILATAAQELPWLTHRHVDVPAAAGVPAAAIAAAAQAGWPSVALRPGAAWIAALERLDLRQTPPGPLPLVHGGAYLLTGGLGGIAMEIARALLVTWEARLLLVGRSPVADSRAAFAALEALPGRVRYAALDVADGPALARAVAGAEADWGRTLDGVFHLAAEYGERAVLDETPAGLAALWHAKLGGAAAVQAIVDTRPGAMQVACSSMGAFFGGAGAAGYAAANACVEALAADARRVGARSVCLTWSLWEGTGMARAFAKADAARARGQRAIGRREGLASLLAILARGEAAAYVGLDDANRVVRSALRGVPPPARRLVAVVEAPEPAPAAQAIDDGFGVAVPLDGRQVPRLPRLASGAVDREALRLPGALERGAAAEAPRSDVEARVQAVWAEVLGRQAVGIHENFFDLGGTSIDVTRMAGLLRERFARPVQTTIVYQHPTVAAQAAFLAAPATTASPAVSASAARGLARRERARARAGTQA